MLWSWKSLYKATLSEFTITVKIVFNQKHLGSNVTTANIALQKNSTQDKEKGELKGQIT